MHMLCVVAHYAYIWCVWFLCWSWRWKALVMLLIVVGYIEAWEYKENNKHIMMRHSKKNFRVNSILIHRRLEVLHENHIKIKAKTSIHHFTKRFCCHVYNISSRVEIWIHLFVYIPIILYIKTVHSRALKFTKIYTNWMITHAYCGL